MSGDQFAKFFPCILLPGFDQLHAGHDQTRRTESALNRGFIDKRLLDRSQFSGRALQPFCCQDVFPFRPHGEIQAGIDRDTVDQYRTCAALSDTAASFHRGQSEPFTQSLHEALSGIHRQFHFFSIDGHMHYIKHPCHRPFRARSLPSVRALPVPRSTADEILSMLSRRIAD